MMQVSGHRCHGEVGMVGVGVVCGAGHLVCAIWACETSIGPLDGHVMGGQMLASPSAQVKRQSKSSCSTVQ